MLNKNFERLKITRSFFSELFKTKNQFENPQFFNYELLQAGPALENLADNQSFKAQVLSQNNPIGMYSQIMVEILVFFKKNPNLRNFIGDTLR